MARVLLVEDDRTQLGIRKLLVERAGHGVATALTAAEARESFAAAAPDVVILDLAMPEVKDGLALIREFRAARPNVRIVVLSGYTGDLDSRDEGAMVDKVLTKPIRSEKLLALLAQWMLVLTLCWLPLGAQSYPFAAKQGAEVVAELEMEAPGANWGVPAKEAPLADVAVDGGAPRQVMVSAGDQPHVYPMFLGKVSPGRHRLRIERNGSYSAPGAALRVICVSFHEYASGDPYSLVLAHAPVLFARADTVGRFTDAPLILYAERKEENGQTLLEYTMIFSNEDGGTPTRALMARWGRTTDIEYIYRAYLTRDGGLQRATIQGRGHKEIAFDGKFDAQHPLLIPVTDNNMVSGEASSPIRYQIAPVVANLGEDSREQVMNDHPWSYRIMAEELSREGKLRPFGVVDGQKISDPRNYLYIEAHVSNRHSGIAAVVRLKGDRTWRSSDLGREDYAIDRDGWVQTTVELPPGTRPDQVAAIGFTCLVVRPDKEKLPLSGTCTLGAVNKAFFLGRDYRPEPSIWSLHGQPVEIPSGQTITWPVHH